MAVFGCGMEDGAREIVPERQQGWGEERQELVQLASFGRGVQGCGSKRGLRGEVRALGGTVGHIHRYSDGPDLGGQGQVVPLRRGLNPPAVEVREQRPKSFGRNGGHHAVA